ncbi:putative odorant receptor 69a [Drosophila busckii]|uniref:putative odorant receptor 69a n=1 Tax=Drosophila busckii TaxID=30019 RepID=UPI001432C3F8|nr:putative odorant receptor 69a [Drosophila busckii]
MQLHEFMHYPHLGCRLTMMRRYEWQGSGVPQEQQTRLQRAFFYFGAFNLIYQNLGLAINLFLVQPQRLQLSAFVAEISETCSVMGLTLVSACDLWLLEHHRPDIEFLLSELQKLFEQRTRNRNRVAYYYSTSSRLMRYTTIFFVFACIYYNLLPILELLYEMLAQSQHIRYKSQSNTWYPWQLFAAPDSYLSFLAAYVCQGMSSLVGVAFIMASQFLLCFFITQMQLHFDTLASGLGALDARQSTANMQLKNLIAYHSRLLKLGDLLNRIFNFIFLINFTTSTIAICLMCFAMVMINLASAFKYSVGLMAFLVFTFFICYQGTKFTKASDKVLPAAFYNNWYEGDLAYRKMLLFLMMRASQSRVLRAYKFTPVSLATFMAILKFSYQLFTFVHSMISEN